MTFPQVLGLRTASPVFHRAGLSDATDRSVRRRLGWVWGLLFLNVLTFTKTPDILPIPSTLGKIITQGALLGALGVALSLNRKMIVRPNGFLLLFTIFAILSLIVSLRGYFGLGSIVRAARLVLFVLVLWLLTPWWGRRDLLFAHIHRRALAVILGSVVLGMMMAPGKSFAQAGGGRLGGAVWPIPPTEVAHFAAVFVGLSVVMWFTGLVSRRSAVIAVIAGVVVLLLTHTRTAVIGLLVGILAAGLSLFFSRKRVRRAFVVTLLVAGIVALSFAPFVTHWFSRGESAQQLSGLNGRAAVWSALVHQPRGEVNIVLGYGMSNDSYNGLSIDSSWLAIYLDQGVVGDVLVAVAMLLILLLALMAPRGPARAIAIFLLVYCLIASYTEVGLGNASGYLLDLTVTMSLLAPWMASGPRRLPFVGSRRPRQPA